MHRRTLDVGIKRGAPMPPKKEDDISSYVFGGFILLAMIGGIIWYIAYENTITVEATTITILDQELIEHFGMYGARWYEYRNIVRFDDNETVMNIDSIAMMSRFKTKDRVTISVKYQTVNDEKIVKAVWYTTPQKRI
jgi:hypothetical protein